MAIDSYGQLYLALRHGLMVGRAACRFRRGRPADYVSKVEDGVSFGGGPRGISSVTGASRLTCCQADANIYNHGPDPASTAPP